MDKVIFITGVSSGFGKDLLHEAAKAGYTIAGTVRKQEQLEEINRVKEGKTFGYLLDVNDHESVKKVIGEVADKFGRLDVVINNAGYGLMGAVEEVSMEEARLQMETNFFGALAVTQAAIPVMRKQGHGHIIQFSSVAGIMATPGLGLYNASKFALEGFSEALRPELAPFGINVTIVEPGPFRTLWAGANLNRAATLVDGYEETAHKTYNMVSGYSGNQPGDPVKGAQAVLRIIEAENPPLRLLLGKIALQRGQAKIKLLQDDFDTWQDLSASADFETS